MNRLLINQSSTITEIIKFYFFNEDIHISIISWLVFICIIILIIEDMVNEV